VQTNVRPKGHTFERQFAEGNINLELLASLLVTIDQLADSPSCDALTACEDASAIFSA
jgi:hypothetical protein